MLSQDRVDAAAGLLYLLERVALDSTLTVARASSTTARSGRHAQVLSLIRTRRERELCFFRSKRTAYSPACAVGLSCAYRGSPHGVGHRST